MLRITPRATDDDYTLKLEGCLYGALVAELESSWHVATAVADGRAIHVDLTDVCYVDEDGRELMTRMYRAGVRFVANGCVMPELVREIAEVVHNGRRG